MKIIVNFLALFAIATVICACSGGSSEREAQAVALVQNSPTAIQGRTTLQLLTDLAVVSKAGGNNIKPLGWMGIVDTGDNLRVIFDIEENGKKLRYEWLVSSGKISPANQLTKDLSTIGTSK